MGIEKLADFIPAEIIDLSPILETQIMKEDRFISTIGLGPKATNYKIEWEEEEIDTQKATAHASTGSLTTTGTTLNLAAGEGVKIRVGMILEDLTVGKSEQVQVTVITTDALTITRLYPTGGTGETHANGAIWMIAEAPVHERYTPAILDYPDRVGKDNNCQLFIRDADASLIWQYLENKVVDDEYKHRMEGRIAQLLVEYNRAFILSKKGAVAIGGYTYYTMSGLIEQVSQTGGHVFTDAAALTPDIIDALNADIRTTCPLEGLPNHILLSESLGGAISSFDEAKVRLEPVDTARGREAALVFRCKLGNKLKIVQDSSMRSGAIALYNAADIKRRMWIPLFPREIPTAALVKQGQLVTAMTMEYRCSKERGGYRSNLS